MQTLHLVKAIIEHTGRNGKRYLLLQKANDKFFPENIGKWECSGGLIKEGENSEEAITREVKEETGLDFKIVKQLPHLSTKDENYDSQCDVYLIKTEANKVKINTKEHLSYKWVKAKNVKKMNLVLYAGLLLEFFNNSEKYL